MNRRLIDISTGIVMLAGAALALSLATQDKGPGLVIVHGWELIIFGAMGAMPGWIVNGLLKRWYFPKTHGEAQTRQPRCRHCGAVLAQAGMRCDDCKGF
jgi:hypothetical protein